MAGPWERYQQPAAQPAPAAVGPWNKFSAAAPEPIKSLPDVVVQATPEEVAAAQPRSIGQDLLRAGVMTGRNVLHGALAPVTTLNDATLVPAINAISRLLGSSHREAPSSQQLDNLLNSMGLPNPQPENATERVVSGIDRGAGGLLSGVGIGGLLRNATGAATKGIGDVLTSNLGAQTSATAFGTGAGEISRESGASPGTQLAFGLAGGLSPVGFGAAKGGTIAATRQLFGSASPEATALGQQALDMGIPLKASQVSPSRVAKLMDSVTGQVPFSGAHSFQNTQQQAFNRAVGRTIEADSPVINAPVFEQAKNAAGSAFDRMWSTNNMPVNQPVLKRAADVVNVAASDASPDVANSLGRMLDEIATKGASGQLPGRAFQSIDSRLGSMVADGGEKGHFAGQLQETLRDAMEAGMSPADAQRLGEIRGVWRNLKTIEPLIAGNAVEGNISPARLLGRVNANGAGKAAMATGSRGDLGDLANIGQRFIKEPIPDSGTAQRNAVFRGLGKLGGVVTGLGAGAYTAGLPATLVTSAGAVGGARATQSLLQNPALVNQLLGRSSPSDLGRLLMLSGNPTAQSLIQTGQ